MKKSTERVFITMIVIVVMAYDSYDPNALFI